MYGFQTLTLLLNVYEIEVICYSSLTLEFIPALQYTCMYIKLPDFNFT